MVAHKSECSGCIGDSRGKDDRKRNVLIIGYVIRTGRRGDRNAGNRVRHFCSVKMGFCFEFVYAPVPLVCPSLFWWCFNIGSSVGGTNAT